MAHLDSQVGKRRSPSRSITSLYGDAVTGRSGQLADAQTPFSRPSCFPRKPDGTGGIQFVNVLRNLSHDTGTSSNASQPGIQAAAGPPGTPASSPIAWGHWNDPDYLGPGLGMTDTQAQSQFSMWAMVAAPLILGSDPRLLSTTNLNMLENPRVIAIDQDSLGAQGYLLSRSGSAQVWVKPLAGGARAVALFNTGSSSQQISTSASTIGMPRAGQYKLLNVWTNQTSSTKRTRSARPCQRTPSCCIGSRSRKSAPRQNRADVHVAARLTLVL